MRLLDDSLHHRCEPGDRAAAQVVAVREPAGKDHGIDVPNVVVAVPQRHRLAACQSNGACRVTIVQRTGEGDDPDTKAQRVSSITRR